MRARGLGFVPHVAARYLRATRASGRIASSALSILGVAAGVMTLVAVTGVMNGFQLGFIEDIVEVSSYHLQIEGPGLDARVLEALRDLEGVSAVVAFSDDQAIVESEVSELHGCIVRGIESDAPAQDATFAEHVRIVEGLFAVDEPLAIVIGAELAQTLGVRTGDSIRMLSLSSRADGAVSPAWEALRVAGVFQTGYLEYDTGMAFVSLETAGTLFHGGSPPPLVYGIKLATRFADREAAERVRRLLQGTGASESYRVASWRDFNRAFFSALLLERVLMLALPGLIFVVVAFSIYHSLRRTVYERREEIALFAALGARRGSIRAIFVLEGALIGLAGGLPGLVGGLLVSANVNGVFRFTEGLVNGALSLLDLLLAPLLARSSGAFSIFSPAFFYVTEVPSRVPLVDAFGITFAGVLSAATAALLASRRILELPPAEVLRYE